MKLLRVSSALAGLLALAPHAARADHRAPLTLAVYGDAPYGTSPTDTSQLAATPAFIDAVNADPDVSLVVHVGDIHSGKQYCTEAYDQAVAALWTGFADPLIYTPGDNEWADCHKKAEGGGVYNAATGAIDYLRDAAGELVDYAGGDPLANLDLIRTTFFPRAGVALGGGRKYVASQAWFHDWFHPEDAEFVENVIWEQERVVFVTINLPGGSNNDQDPWYGAPSESAAQADERTRRTAADVRWLDAAFATARFLRARGVVVIAQADMWDPEKGAAHQAGYEPVVATLAAGATKFGGPVLLLNGDSHEYRSDSPLAAADPLHYMHPAYDVANVHRVVVHGSTTPLEYLKLVVDPRQDAPNGADAFGPFRWTRVIE